MKLKRFIGLYTFFLFFGIVTCQSQASIPKVEKIYKNIPELIIKDSLFLCGIDSLIFKSFCPEIKRKVFKTFNIISQKRNGYFSLIFSLCPQFEYYERVALKGYFKYTSVEINKSNDEMKYLIGQPDTCQIFIALGDWSEPVEIRTKPSDRKLFDKNDPHIIAYADMYSGKSVTEYTPFTLELEYRDTDRIPTYIVVVASASKYGDYFTGGDGSVLFLDDFTLEYDY